MSEARRCGLPGHVASTERLGVGAEACPPAQAFGIIDPDYARIFTQARILAWQYGWACLAHGTFTRDLDLLLVPWADRAVKDPSGIVHRIADVCGLQVQGEPSEKPCGRRAWSLLLPGFSEVRWVDVSAFATPEAPNEVLGVSGAGAWRRTMGDTTAPDTKADPLRAEIERKAGYWRAFTFAVSTRGATLAKVNDRRGRECWECTVGRSTVQRLSAESAIHGALWLEFDGNVPESFGLPKSTLRPLVWSGS